MDDAPKEGNYKFVKQYRQEHGHLWYKYKTKRPEWITPAEMRARIEKYRPLRDLHAQKREEARLAGGSGKLNKEYNRQNQMYFKYDKMIEHWEKELRKCKDDNQESGEDGNSQG